MKNLIPLFLMVGLMACSSIQTVETQKYAELRDTETFEYDFRRVWEGIEQVMKKYEVAKRDPSEVPEDQVTSISSRRIETGWVTELSNEKYVEYQMNGLPRKRYVQIRYRYIVKATKAMGGTEVKVELVQEVENLKEDGTSAGFASVRKPDRSLANQLLEKIRLAILSA